MTLYIHPSPSSERRRLSQTFDRAKHGDPLNLEDVKTLISALVEQNNLDPDAPLLINSLPQDEQLEAYLHYASKVGLMSREPHASDDTGLSFERFLGNASSLIDKLPVDERHDAWVKVWTEYAKGQSHENPELADTTSKFLREIVNSIALLKPEKRYTAAASLLNNIHGMKDGADRLDIEEQAYSIALQSIAGDTAYDKAVDLHHDLRAYHTLRPQDDREQFKKSKTEFQDLMQAALQRAMDAAGRSNPHQRFDRLLSIYKKTRHVSRHDDEYNKFRKSVLANAAHAINTLPVAQRKKALLRIHELDDQEATQSADGVSRRKKSKLALSLEDAIKVIDIVAAEKKSSSDFFTLVKRLRKGQQVRAYKHYAASLGPSTDLYTRIRELPKGEQFEAYMHFASTMSLRPRSQITSGVTALAFEELLENVSPLIDTLNVNKRHDASWQIWNLYTKDKHHENPKLVNTTTFFLKEILTRIECLEQPERYDAAVNLLNKIHELTDRHGDRLGLEEQVYETALKDVKDGEETYDRAIGIYHDLRAYHTLRPQDDKAEFERNEFKFQGHMQSALAKAVEAAERLDAGQRFERLISIYKKTRRDFSEDKDFRLSVLQKAAHAIDGLPENQQEDAAYWIYEQTDNYETLDVGNPAWAKRLRQTISDELEAVKSTLIDPGLS